MESTNPSNPSMNSSAKYNISMILVAELLDSLNQCIYSLSSSKLESWKVDQPGESAEEISSVTKFGKSTFWNFKMQTLEVNTVLVVVGKCSNLEPFL